MSRKNPHRTLTSPARACACCGRLVVLLRRTDSPPGQTRWVACYIKGWDGNPYYVPGTHRRHPARRYAANMAAKKPPEDPFFTLD